MYDAASDAAKEALAQVVDRSSEKDARPAQGVKDEPLDRDGPPRGAARKALQGPRFRVSDPLDAASGRVHRHLRQHVRPRRPGRPSLSARALSSRSLVVARRLVTSPPSARSSQARTRAAPRGQGIDLRAEAGRVTRCCSPATSRYPASASRRSLRSARSGGVRRSACSASSTASMRAASGGRSARPRPRRWRQALHPHARSRARGAVRAAPRRRRCLPPRDGARAARRGRARLLAAAASSGWEGTHPVPVDKEQPSVERLLDGGWVLRSPRAGTGASPRSGRPPGAAFAPASEAHPRECPGGPRRSRAPACPHRWPASPWAARVRPSSRAKSGFPSVVSNEPAKDLPRQAQLEAIRQHPSRRAEAERTDLEPLELPPRERLLQASEGLPGRSASRKSNRLVLEPPRGERRAPRPTERSSHWTSSTATSSGPRNRQRPQGVQEAERDRSGLRRQRRSASARRSATSSARSCGAGNPASSSVPTPSSRSISAANESRASAPLARAERTRSPAPAAAATPASHSVVFPIPGPPRSTRTSRSSSAPTNSCRTASSRSRPTIGAPTRPIPALRHSTHRTLFTSWITRAPSGSQHPECLRRAPTQKGEPFQAWGARA